MQYDIVIVGGGIVGITAALALAEATSLRIALIDARKLTPSYSSEVPSFRVSAISLASQRILKNLNVWDLIQEKRLAPYKKMQVWDECGSGELHFDCTSIYEKQLGFIIEDEVIRSSLLERLEEYSQVEKISPLNLVSIFKNKDGYELIADDGLTLNATLVIAADGGNSWVREQVEINIENKNYGHEAIVATVHIALPHKAVARQRFLSTGPLAFLPLADEHTCSIVWSTSIEKAEELLALDDKGFQEALGRAFDKTLGEITKCSQRYRFSLQMRHAKNYVKDNLALIGDAAHTIHPLAGQGVNMGLLDAASLVEVIATAISKKRNYASLATLRRYERWRKSDNAIMLNFVSAIKKIFGSNVSAVQHVRNIGLSITNQVDFLKNYFANYAAGNRDDLPELAKIKKDKTCV